MKFIDFKMGEESGYIRFEAPEAAQKARAAAVLTEQGGLAVKNFIATLEPVSGIVRNFTVLVQISVYSCCELFSLLLILILPKRSICNINCRCFF